MLTRQFFDRLFPIKGLSARKYNLIRERDRLIAALNQFFPKYEINTHKRIVAFLANCGIETDYFKTTIEYASGAAYEGRHDLGNIKTGDGRRFKGRGLTQTTGRYNYEAVQKAIGETLKIDVVANPDLLAEIEIAVESACIFWRDNKLNDWADAGAFKPLSGIVNRGDRRKTPLHWPKRLALYKTLLSKIPAGIVLIEELPENQNAALTATSIPVPEPTTGISLQAISNKYLRHAPADTVKNILLVAVGRISGGVATIWSLGIHGKVISILTAAALTGPLAYAVYFYRWRIVGWAQTIADSFLGND